MNEIIKLEDIAQLIYIIRGQKVIFDFDLAMLYQVENRALKRQVKTNMNRFPHDFMFQLTKLEWLELVQKLHRLQNLKYTAFLPFGFTEQGVAMLSSVLRSEKAIEVNIAIMRAFIAQRKFMINNETILKEIFDLRREVDFKFLEHDDRKIGFDTGS